MTEPLGASHLLPSQSSSTRFTSCRASGRSSAAADVSLSCRACLAEALALAQAIIEPEGEDGPLLGVPERHGERPCTVCCDGSRDRTLICVVEEPLDILAVERTRGFHGLYHVLHGHLADGRWPDDLKVANCYMVARRRGNGSDGDEPEPRG